MDNFILISKLVDCAGGCHRFHFRGYFYGKKVKSIIVNKFFGEVEKDTNYLLYLKKDKLEDEILKATIIKYLKVDEVNF